MRRLLVLLILIGLMVSIAPQNASPKIQAQENPFGAEWFTQEIMYEVFVRSFRDSDGDGIGDLQGVIGGLDYIQSLGANTIWLMPIHPSPSYHGYDITDYYAINPDYGTQEDMFALIDAVHARGMHIIIDYVVNHSSNQHPFFTDAIGNLDSDYADYYKWTDDDHIDYRGFAGLRFMPEWNFDTPAVRQYMLDMATYWLDPNGDGDTSDGVDGLRCDVAVGPPLSFWQELRTATSAVNPDVLLLGEAWITSGIELKTYVQGSAFNAVFDFPTLKSVTADHDTNNDGAVSGIASAEFIELSLKGATKLYPEGAHLVRFIGNHDTNRFMSEVDGDWQRARAGAVFLLTGPSTPMIYYGDEIGMFGTKGTSEFYDEFRREPMDWYARGRGDAMTTWFRPGNRNNLSNDGISVEEQEADPTSLLTLYRALGAFRNSTSSLWGDFGTFKVSEEGTDLYNIWRGDLNGEFVLVVINFTQNPVTATITDEDLPVENLASLNTIFAERWQADGLEFTVEPGGFAVLSNN